MGVDRERDPRAIVDIQGVIGAAKIEPKLMANAGISVARQLPRSIETYFAVTEQTGARIGEEASWDGPDNREENGTFLAYFLSIGILPRDALELSPIYSGLTRVFNESRTSLKVNDSFDRLKTLHMVSNILLHQTFLPMRDKYAIRAVAPEAPREYAVPVSAQMAGELTHEPRVEQERATLINSMGKFEEGLIEEFSIDQEERPRVIRQMNIIDGMLSESGYSLAELFAGDPKVVLRRRGLVQEGIHFVATDPYVIDELLHDRLEDAPSRSRSEVVMRALEVEIHGGDSQSELASELGRYYLRHADVQKEVRDSIYKNRDDVEHVIDWFMTQSPQHAEEFTRTLFSSEWRKLSGGRKKISMSKLLGVIAEFQTRNPDHENLDIIHGTADHFARTLGVYSAIKPMSDVLAGNASGSIYKNQNGHVNVELPDSEDQDWGVFRESIEAHEDFGSIMYEAPHHKNLAVESGVVVHASVKPAVEIVPRTVQNRLDLTGGELALSQSRWPNAQLLRPEDIGLLSEHIDANLIHHRFDEGQTFELIEHVLRMPRPSKQVRQNFPALFPALHLDNQRLLLMDQIGIQSVESSNGTVTVVFDAARAGIDTVGPSRILVRGTMNQNGEFVVGRDAQKLPDSNLEFLVTHAARFSMQHATSHQELGEEDLSAVQNTVRDYNSKQRDTGAPTIDMPRKPGAQAINRTQDYVVVPTRRKDHMVSLRLNWK